MSRERLSPSVRLERLITRSYPRLSGACDSALGLFEVLDLDIGPSTARCAAKLRDHESYGPFPMIELHHLMLFTNMLVIAAGEANGVFVSALIRNLSLACRKPVPVGKPFSVGVTLGTLTSSGRLSATANINDRAILLEYRLRCFTALGELEAAVVGRDRESRG